MEQNKRKILLVGEINTEIASGVIEQLLALNDSADDVYLYINSPGGSIDAAVGIIETMNIVQYDVGVVVLGSAASAAGLIAALGKRGKRYICPKSHIMLHPTFYEQLDGEGSKIIEQVKFEQKQEKLLDQLIAKQCGKSFKELQKDLKKDVWLTAKQAINYGAMDHIWNKTLERKTNQCPAKTRQQTKS